MRSGKKTVAGGMILLLVAAAMVWVWKQESSAGRSKAFVSGIDQNPVTGFAGTSANSSLTSANIKVPLPPLDMPVAAMFDDLKRRADQGDARASCRLAVELVNCNQLESLGQLGYMENSRSAEASLAQSGELVAANSVAAQQIKLIESMKRCAGISEGQRKLAGSYLLQAANAGIPEAMVRYAEGQSVTQGNSMYGLLHDKGFSQWHRDAAGLLEKALEHGEPAAVYILYAANSDDNSLIGGLIANDPEKAYSYRLLMNRLRGKNDTPASKLSAAQVAEAGRKATRMHAEYFSNRILREPDAFSSLLTPDWTRPEGSAPRRPCE